MSKGHATQRSQAHLRQVSQPTPRVRVYFGRLLCGRSFERSFVEAIGALSSQSADCCEEGMMRYLRRFLQRWTKCHWTWA